MRCKLPFWRSHTGPDLVRHEHAQRRERFSGVPEELCRGNYAGCIIRTIVLLPLVSPSRMSGPKKTLPAIPSFIVSDSVPMNGEDVAKESFIYSPGVAPETLQEFKSTYKRKTDEQYLLEKQYDITFERKHIKDLVHLITSEIKKKGTKAPMLILPFRPAHHDVDLKNFLNSVFHRGMPVEEQVAKKIIRKTDACILMSALKFLWCRLPGKAVIGWKAYTKFVKLEDSAGFPDKAFLEFMPNCLSSGAHASIVYDFFDLIVALVLDSKENLMSARKLSKMCGLWAFNPVRNQSSGAPSFERGLYEWIPAGDAMYHLLLSFVKAMPPNGDLTRLPKIFQVLLKSSDYPPLPTSATLETSRPLQEIPMVTIRANTPSANPAELLTRVSKTLKFDDATLFYTREDFLLLKRLFKEKDQVVEKLSSEGTRLLENLCLYDSDLICDGDSSSSLKFKLVPGWSTDMTSRKLASSKKGMQEFFTAVIGRASIDDYFIWTWLASLGVEETDLKKKTFGKTYIMEVELAEGFKKWVIIEEQDLERDGYDIELEIKQEKLKQLEQKIQLAEIEAKKVTQDTQHEKKKLMLEKVDADDLKSHQPSTLPPPPVPRKDYDADEIPPRSKSRKPPPPPKGITPSSNVSGASATAMMPPPRSDRRAASPHYVEAQEPEPQPVPAKRYATKVVNNEEIRISLPILDAEDTFLRFDALGISEADLQSPSKTQAHLYEPTGNPNEYVYDNAYGNVNGLANGLNNENAIQNGMMNGDQNGFTNVDENGNLKYTNEAHVNGAHAQRQMYSPGKGTPSPTKYYSPLQSPETSAAINYEMYMQSPTKGQFSNQPYLNQQHISGRSPPHSRSPHQQYSASPRSRSPQTSSSSPRFASPPRNMTSQGSPRNYQNSPPQPQRSPIQRQNIQPTASSNLQSALQNLQSPTQKSAEQTTQQPPLFPIQQQVPHLMPVEQRTTPSNVGFGNESDSVPNLPPPREIGDTTSGDRSSGERSESELTALSRSPVINDIDELEVELKDCMDDLENSSDTLTVQSRNFSNSSRLRKAPPLADTLKTSVFSGTSSAYPATTTVSKDHQTTYPEDLRNAPLPAKPDATSDGPQQSSSLPKQPKRNSPNPNRVVSPPQKPNHQLPTRHFSPQPHHSQHYPPQQYPPQQYLPQGYAPQQYPPQYPYPPQGYSTQQFPPQGYSPQGFPPQGFLPPPQQYPPRQYSPQGYPPPPNQFSPRQYPSQQFSPRQYPPSQFPPNSAGKRVSKSPRNQMPPQYASPNPNMGRSFPPYPQGGFYPPMPPNQYGGPMAYPPHEEQKSSSYSKNIIQHLPPSNRVDKLHGPQNLNKRNARDAFMTGNFGI